MKENLFVAIAESLCARGEDMENVAKDLYKAFCYVVEEAGYDSEIEFHRFKAEN